MAVFTATLTAAFTATPEFSLTDVQEEDVSHHIWREKGEGERERERERRERVVEQKGRKRRKPLPPLWWHSLQYPLLPLWYDQCLASEMCMKIREHVSERYLIERDRECERDEREREREGGRERGREGKKNELYEGACGTIQHKMFCRDISSQITWEWMLALSGHVII